MKQKLLAFFSGFPNYRFNEEVGSRLKQELECRESLVFISAWPEDYLRNDKDSDGMHAMFTEYQIPYKQHYVVDYRMDKTQAQRLVREASCIFLMGGHPGYQKKLLQDLELEEEIHNTKAAVLGVSAGSINMAKHSLDTKESPIPYSGLDLADITIKPHFTLDDKEVVSTLLKISKNIPIFATENESAIFVNNKGVSFVGNIYWVKEGNMAPLTQDNIKGNQFIF